ncbi:MAG: LssY C-terminal domain-containing protein [Acidobacteriia bacterium]|nr:LssY C-terminal domain-containing protein [Terriglobia bacterium]
MHVRLTTPVGTYASKAGSPVSAELIAPVTSASGDILLPAGSILNGTVTRSEKVGYGVRHETAALDLEFREVVFPGGGRIPIATRMSEVDNSRERVTEDGIIRGVRTTSSISYRASGYIRTALCWEIHARLAFWAVKMLLLQVPEPEIYYGPGVELTLWLTQPMAAVPAEESNPALRPAELASLEQELEGMPYRAYTKSNRPSDLVNVILIGSRAQIAEAFAAAGWTEAKAPSWKARANNVRAVVQGQGYRQAPMSRMVINDVEPQMSWQKGLNDVSKRHHIRLWKQPSMWQGQETWVGAATRDVDFAYLRPGQPVTHRIEEDIDLERDKIARDLEFTNCASVDYWDRPGSPVTAHNATGDPMSTDGRLAIVRMNACEAPRGIASAEPLRAHGNYFQRLARRQILSVRCDFYRQNMYWRSYEATRWLVLAARHRHPRPQEFRPVESDSMVARIKNSSWLR